MDFQDLSNMNAHELAAMRRKLAKRTNQRLVRLERSKSPVTGEAYHAGAYDIAQDYLRQIGRKGKRFAETINYTREKNEDGTYYYNVYRLKREIMELDTFLHSKTSTISGNKTAEQKRIDTFSGSKFGLDRETVASKSFYDYLQSNSYDYFVMNSFTSEQMMDVFDAYRREGAMQASIRKGIAQYKIHIKEANANARDGKAKTASIKEMVEYINRATGRELKASDVLKLTE